MEGLGDVDRLLPAHGVDHEQRLRWRHRAGDPHQLVHHRVVDVQASGGVEDDHVLVALPSGLEPGTCDLQRGRADRPGVDLDPDLVTQLHELIDGSGPIDVGGHQERPLPVLAQANPQLGGRGRLSRTLQPNQHEDRWAAPQVQLPTLAAERRDELVVNDLDDLLSGIEPGQEVRAQRALTDAGDELLHHAEVDVRLEQRQADLAQGDVEVGLGDLCFPAQAVDHGLQPGTERFEHWLAR